MHNGEAGKNLNIIVHSVLVAPAAGQIDLLGAAPKSSG
ncbi:hypothetical protein RISK_002307 [Rhodopirellula islandica]|uniref:Uncharacterized protein n=1 Tax=Rhodopirellula islandica TaxID=595434 RepID=A0A0J1BGL1_RHOIS|nr:hypothetical protein RISK_002307 [Rhodopirellula islandica]